VGSLSHTTCQPSSSVRLIRESPAISVPVVREWPDQMERIAKRVGGSGCGCNSGISPGRRTSAARRAEAG
jgi:hypothetical protein